MLLLNPETWANSGPTQNIGPSIWSFQNAFETNKTNTRSLMKNDKNWVGHLINQTEIIFD